MSKTLNQEFRLDTQRRQASFESEGTTVVIEGVEPDVHEQALHELKRAQDKAAKLEARIQELSEIIDQQPSVTGKKQHSDIVEHMISITVFLVAVCIIGVASLTLNAQELLIDQLTARIKRLSIAQSYPSIIFHTDAKTGSITDTVAPWLEPAAAQTQTLAVSIWDDPDDPNSVPYSKLVPPATRDEAMRAALEAASPAVYLLPR